MKHIDAEILIQILNRLKIVFEDLIEQDERKEFFAGKREAMIQILGIVSSLQQKQSEGGCLEIPKESKQEWSEEDEAFLKVAIAICNRYSHKDIADWLKFLPERFEAKEDK